MSVSVFDRGERRFDLMRGDAEIGWIAHRAAGFGGFDNAAAAHRAAAFAFEALTGWVARQRRIDAADRNAHALRVRRNGVVAQLTPGDVSIGRVFPHAAAMARLRSRNGAAFDQPFLKHEVAFHKAVIDSVTSTLLPAVENAGLKTLVVQGAPAFEAHVIAAQNLEKNLAGDDDAAITR